MAPGQRSKGLAGKGAAKGKKPASTGKKGDDDREETLQAVVRIFHSATQVQHPELTRDRS
jgi:hypothetical protein